MKNELGQSVDHFKRAAALAAQETSATVGPRINSAVGRVQPAATKAKDAATTGWGAAVSTLTPLVAAATENVRQRGKITKKQAKKVAKQNARDARKIQKRADEVVSRKQGRRKSRLFGLALLGTAAGFGAAYLAKRRKAEQWDEYEPAVAPISSAQVGGADDAAFEPAEPTHGTQSTGVSETAQNPR